jgi:hypothetical protein
MYLLCCSLLSLRHVRFSSNIPIFDGTSKMAEILCSHADFAVGQCVIKSARLFSDSDFAVAQCAIKSYQLFSDSDFVVAQCAIKSSTLCSD